MSPAQPPRHPTADRTDAPIEAVASRLAAAGALARPLRRVLALLARGRHGLDELVRVPAVARRTVEELLAAAAGDVESDGERYWLAPAVRDRYRERFALDDTGTGEPPAPAGEPLERIRGFIGSGPAPLAALDHVTATPETALRRALWLRDNYELAGARLLCLGDHDLTSLAVCTVEPAASVTVVDLDDRIMAHIDSAAAEHGLAVRTVHADLRFGLPPAVQGCADLVFSDPPYTPEGMALFAGRAVDCLRDIDSGRVLLAYGFSERSPALGGKVQQELLRLGLVFEAVLPGFHRYRGAQAIGSASELYVCQPTSHARKISRRQASEIYTHGPQSVEARAQELPEEALAKLRELGGDALGAPRAPGWQHPVTTGRDEVPLFDLRGDPGPWLLRMLLACNTPRAVFLLPNHHPDITSEHAQHAIAATVRDKYALRFHRSTPDPRQAVLIAEQVGQPVSRTAARLLHRAHGKLGNIWREALISAAEAEGRTLTKRQATELVADTAPHPEDPGLRLVDLPRHRLMTVLSSERGAGSRES